MFFAHLLMGKLEGNLWAVNDYCVFTGEHYFVFFPVQAALEVTRGVSVRANNAIHLSMLEIDDKKQKNFGDFVMQVRPHQTNSALPLYLLGTGEVCASRQNRRNQDETKGTTTFPIRTFLSYEQEETRQF